MSANVYVVTEPKRGAADVSESQIQVLSRMSLGTQVSSESLSLSPPQSTDDDIRPCLHLDPAKPLAELVFQISAQLSPTRSLVSNGVRVAPLSNDGVVMLGQRIDKVALENLPQVQPKQVACSGVRRLIQALQRTKIHLVQAEDSDSDTSDMDTSHHSLPQEYSPANPLGLGLRDPSDLEEGEISDHSHPPEPMDQADTQGPWGLFSWGRS